MDDFKRIGGAILKPTLEQYRHLKEQGQLAIDTNPQILEKYNGIITDNKLNHADYKPNIKTGYLGDDFIQNRISIVIVAERKT